MSERCDPATFTPFGAILQQRHKRRVIDLGSGTLTITSYERRLACEGPSTSNYHRHGDRELSFKILLRPKSVQIIITLALRQRHSLGGSLSSIPKLLISNILPADSLVFKFAAQGRLDDLKSLLAEKKASLHDRSEKGWSLLHVSTLLRFTLQFS